jgi:uncharacterized caspase-like protein
MDRFRSLLLLMFCVLPWVGIPATPAAAESRVALVIGNGAYAHTPRLANPTHDARDMAAALKAHGFQVVEAYDADKRRFDEALRTFSGRLGQADVALLFYAGHGVQVGLQNYILPVDARLERERDLEFEAIKLDFVLRQMELDREGKTSIVILDACRDNPLARNLARSMGTRSTAIGRGLATTPAGLGTFIAYSTQPGNVALDGSGRNSPFAAALLKHLPVPGRNLPALLIEVRKEVVAVTNGQQVPWDHSALTADFTFVPAAAVARDDGTAASPPPRELRTAVAPPAALPAIRKAGDEAARSAASFEATDNVRLEGSVFSSARQPNVDACRQQCDADPLCRGYQHGRRNPVMGQCQLFDRIDARQEDAHWRSGVRRGS